MDSKRMIGAEEISKELGVSKGYAYRLIRLLNNELREKGTIVLSGKVDRGYFEYRFFNMREDGSRERK